MSKTPAAVPGLGVWVKAPRGGLGGQVSGLGKAVTTVMKSPHAGLLFWRTALLWAELCTTKKTSYSEALPDTLGCDYLETVPLKRGFG